MLATLLQTILPSRAGCRFGLLGPHAARRRDPARAAAGHAAARVHHVLGGEAVRVQTARPRLLRHVVGLSRQRHLVDLQVVGLHHCAANTIATATDSVT